MLLPLLGLVAACGPTSEDLMEQRLSAMQGHAEHGLAAIDGFEKGDLPRVRTAGAGLADEAPWVAFPDAAHPGLEALRARAEGLARAEDWDQAATALSVVALSCGSCHAASQVTVPVRDTEGAAGQLWQAVAFHDDEAWTRVSRGVERLTRSGWEARSVALGAELSHLARSRRPDWVGQRLSRHMHAHFDTATDAVWHLALGDLERVRAHAAALDHAPHPGLPSAHRPAYDAMVAAARALATSKGPAQAATRSVALAARCAGCHQEIGAIAPLTPDQARLPDMGTVGDHVMGPYLLWVGLVVPSDVAWQEGAQTLVLPSVPAAAAQHRATFEGLSGRARGASASARGAIFAELIQTCGSCHRAAGVVLEL